MAEAKLEEIIQSALIVLGLEYVGCELTTQAGRQLLRVYIDNEGGVTLDDCEQASRQISALLDVEDPFSSRYNLEVSSPGLNRPLFTQEHFARYAGSRAKIRLRIPHNGRRNYVGVIKAVANDNVSIVVDDETFDLPIADIDKANLVPDF